MENYDINIKVYSTEFTNENKGIFCRIIMSIKKRRLPFPISLNIIIFNSTELKKKEKGAAYIIMYVTPNIYVGPNYQVYKGPFYLMNINRSKRC